MSKLNRITCISIASSCDEGGKYSKIYVVYYAQQHKPTRDGQHMLLIQHLFCTNIKNGSSLNKYFLRSKLKQVKHYPLLCELSEITEKVYLSIVYDFR